MEREPITLTDEEWVSRILGLPMERIEFLQENHGLVCGKEEFPGWFIENAALVLEEKERYLEALLFAGELRPEPAEPPLP